MMKTKSKISPLRISPVFGPNLGKDQKKKKVITQILSLLCAQTFCPSYKWGAMPQFCILFYADYTILATQKGGPLAPCPPLNTPLLVAYSRRWKLKK